VKLRRKMLYSDFFQIYSLETASMPERLIFKVFESREDDSPSSSFVVSVVVSVLVINYQQTPPPRPFSSQPSRRLQRYT
jgi:hypothetical protein